MGFVYGKTVFISGASSGIGNAAARLLARNGYKVYGTSRSPQPDIVSADLHSLGENGQGFIKLLQMDVCDEASIEKAVSCIIEIEGTIDILINSAGFALAGAVEDVSAAEAYRQFDTNLFGTMRVCQRVIPIMRKQGKGLIINIGSVAGLITIPFQAMYSASKYALEALSEALRIETRPFGIRVCLVEPGDTRTGFTKSRQFAKASREKSFYMGRFEKSVEIMEKSELDGPPPEKVAQVILKILKKKNPPIRWIAGIQYKAFGVLKRLLPSRLVEFIITKLYG